MPTPRKKEKKNKFISRCISQVVDEGKDSKQAQAICFSLWENRKKKSKSTFSKFVARLANDKD